jgi:argininosuccinate lyase
VPFKTAHAIVGRLIKHSIDKGVLIKGMSENELKEFSDKFVKREIMRLFDPSVSVKSKRSIRRN